ncbi:MAG: TIGR01777 family protein [Sphingobacteriales bacterium]|nr:MAG: TIGR01777 family protein [Sphingobacteriales bacterium]
MTQKQQILITGASGLIGSRLTEFLIERGYVVKHLVRSPKPNASIPTFKWNVEKGIIDAEALSDTEIVVHLAGAGIGDKRWTTHNRRQIVNSRTQSTALLVNTLSQLKQHRVKTIIGASAIGYYGNRADQLLSESDLPQENDFLSETTRLWEQSYLPFINELGIRSCIFRIGIVLSNKGGALPKMDLPVRFCAPGFYFGTGKQFYSWIHIDDLCRLFIHAIENTHMSGTYNAVSPNPVTNKEFVLSILSAKERYALALPVPEWALRIGLGQMADIIFHSAKASSSKVENSGFSFNFPNLRSALKNIYDKP